MRIKFTGKNDPFMILGRGNLEKNYSRDEAVAFCDVLAMAGQQHTKKICRVVRTVLRNQKSIVEPKSVSE